MHFQTILLCYKNLSQGVISKEFYSNESPHRLDWTDIEDYEDLYKEYLQEKDQLSKKQLKEWAEKLWEIESKYSIEVVLELRSIVTENFV